jgi:hypothetical protein
MKAIDRRAAEEWAVAHGYTLNSRGLPGLRDSDQIERFTIPKDAGQRVALVKGHMRAFRDEEEVCIWIYDWSVWPSGQWEHVYDRFRLSYGISGTIADYPAHIIPKIEFEAAISTVVYSVLMLWDCHVLGLSGRPFAFYSHDEFGKKNS